MFCWEFRIKFSLDVNNVIVVIGIIGFKYFKIICSFVII